MSLDSDLINKGEKKEFESRGAHKKAKKFSDLVWAHKNKEALKYYRKLDNKVQDYIRGHKFYRMDLKSASLGGL